MTKTFVGLVCVWGVIFDLITILILQIIWLLSQKWLTNIKAIKSEKVKLC